MPNFLFLILTSDDQTTADLPDRRAARDYAIGIAETLLNKQAEVADTGTTLIEIRDDEGALLDTIRSEIG